MRLRFSLAPLLVLVLAFVSGAAAAQSCTSGPAALCLNDGRFQVTVSWIAQDTSGVGRAVSLTQDSGAFWFFSADNLELIVKVLDGRALNGAFWVFYGALSDVEYTIQVTDVTTGATQSYVNASGTLASAADIDAFPSASAALDATVLSGASFRVDRHAFPEEAPSAQSVAADEDPLIALFNFSPSSPSTGSPITFTDASIGGPDAWCWNFGDGSQDCSSSTVTHTYTTAGTFTVRLEVRRFDGQTVTVAQTTRSVTVSSGGGQVCSFSISPTSFDPFSAAGGTGTITVTTTSSCTWPVFSLSNFLSIPFGATHTGSGTVQFQVAANTGNSSRTGILIVALKSILVTQQGKACATLSPQSASFEAAGGTAEIAVSAPSSCSWTAVSNSSFLTVLSGASGTGNGTVRYRVKAHPGHNERTGTLTVGGKSFQVKQSGVPCTYTLTPDTTAFDALGGVGVVNVATDPDCSWQASSDAPFLEPATGTGTGSGTLTFCVAANRGAARTANLSIGGETLTVTQDAVPGAPPAGCATDPQALCLQNRFEVRTLFRDVDAENRPGTPVALTSQSAYFYFFDSANVELLTKVLDGRAITGHYWFFYGSLSNVAYAITLTDTQTGANQLYCNPRGTLRSVGDTEALPAE